MSELLDRSTIGAAATELAETVASMPAESMMSVDFMMEMTGCTKLKYERIGASEKIDSRL